MKSFDRTYVWHKWNNEDEVQKYLRIPAALHAKSDITLISLMDRMSSWMDFQDQSITFWRIKKSGVYRPKDETINLGQSNEQSRYRLSGDSAQRKIFHSHILLAMQCRHPVTHLCKVLNIGGVIECQVNREVFTSMQLASKNISCCQSCFLIIEKTG